MLRGELTSCTIDRGVTAGGEEEAAAQEDQVDRCDRRRGQLGQHRSQGEQRTSDGEGRTGHRIDPDEPDRHRGPGSDPMHHPVDEDLDVAALAGLAGVPGRDGPVRPPPLDAANERATAAAGLQFTRRRNLKGRLPRHEVGPIGSRHRRCLSTAPSL
jgi:hypothetical protein